LVIIISLRCSREFKKPQKIIDNYADKAILSINEQIDSVKINLKTIILPFRGYSDYRVEGFVEYQDDLNYDERYFESLIYERLVFIVHPIVQTKILII